VWVTEFIYENLISTRSVLRRFLSDALIFKSIFLKHGLKRILLVKGWPKCTFLIAYIRFSLNWTKKIKLKIELKIWILFLYLQLRQFFWSLQDPSIQNSALEFVMIEYRHWFRILRYQEPNWHIEEDMLDFFHDEWNLNFMAYEIYTDHIRSCSEQQYSPGQHNSDVETSNKHYS
jgi:hypothetical protein